jgi:hypothetical protein
MVPATGWRRRSATSFDTLWAGHPVPDRSLQRYSDWVLAKLREALVLPPEADLAYLLPIFELWRSQGSLKVATLNYDLTIETAAQSAGVECDTGVESWARDGNFEWASQAVHLIKLHGSLDWSSTPSIATGPPAWQLPASTFAKADANTAARDLGLVFGQRDKLRPDGPYLGLLAQFEAHLRQTGELVVIGYSFRDAHVNEMIARWANADRTRLLTVVDPFFPELPPTAPGWFGRRDFQTSVIKALWYNGSESEPPENPRLTVYRESVASCLPAALAV